MLRSVLIAMAAVATIGIVSGTGCNSAGVGDPCTPEEEYQQSFLGFSVREVSVESKSFQCQTRSCLVNHFQGRVSCPYGQTSTPGSQVGLGPDGTTKTACTTPTLQNPINGVLQTSPLQLSDPVNGAVVLPQCLARRTHNAVYCSCRCANVKGKTDDGFNYCTCPDTFHCAQVVTSIGQGNEGLTGGYCVRDGTDYNNDNCSGPQVECSDTGGVGNCESAQNIRGTSPVPN
jgi:hypothetical protein